MIETSMEPRPGRGSCESKARFRSPQGHTPSNGHLKLCELKEEKHIREDPTHQVYGSFQFPTHRKPELEPIP